MFPLFGFSRLFCRHLQKKFVSTYLKAKFVGPHCMLIQVPRFQNEARIKSYLFVASRGPFDSRHRVSRDNHCWYGRGGWRFLIWAVHLELRQLLFEISTAFVKVWSLTTDKTMILAIFVRKGLSLFIQLFSRSLAFCLPVRLFVCLLATSLFPSFLSSVIHTVSHLESHLVRKSDRQSVTADSQ